jgi:NADPH:quinone reductase-like Zn-dependent oxidoreductase
MKAIVVDQPGGAEVLQIRDIPTPELKPGWVLVRVRAFGLNRSELYTRQGHSGEAVPFPRVLGIECVGEVVDPSDSGLAVGQKVAALMGFMGRQYDGGYAEYALLPLAQIIPINTTLSWAEFGAIPETFITAYGSLETLDLQPGQSLLVRGGTSSVGMAAVTIAKDMGLTVLATTRHEAKRPALLANGVDHALLDQGSIAGTVRKLFPNGVDAVLELVGQPTLHDSVAGLKPDGIICQTGLLGDKWDYWVTEMPGATASIRRTLYDSEAVNAANSGATLQLIVDRVENGRYRLNLDRVFAFADIVEAHQVMEESRAQGKLVVVVDANET